MLVKDLLNNKREYYESERELGEEINQFIRATVRSINPTVDAKNYYIKIEFKEKGQYGNDELVITSVADYLTDEVIGALAQKYNLKVSYKCVQTGFNVDTNEINIQSRVFFRYNHDIDEEIVELDIESDEEDEELLEEENDNSSNEEDLEDE